MQEPNLDKKAQMRRIQTDIMILDADLKKKVRAKEEILMELKRLKREQDMLMVEIKNKDSELKKIDNDQMMLMNEIKSLKKKLNVL